MNALLTFEILSNKKRVYDSQTDQEMRTRIKNEAKSIFWLTLTQSIAFTVFFMPKSIHMLILIENPTLLNILLNRILNFFFEIMLCFNFASLMILNKAFHSEYNSLKTRCKAIFSKNVNK